jgi:NAD(P)-dependent dehydrogenase (short-subunit alcohol dehydrogenase family)
MATTKPTLACFGATGGCTAAALTQALKEGHRATALARTPSKLETILRRNGVQDDAMANLSIIQGDVNNRDAVAQTLRSAASPNHLADFIISGIGGSPKLQMSLIKPVTLDNPNICTQAAEAILESLRHLSENAQPTVNSTSTGGKPVFVGISTTGISTRKRDVPIAFLPLYRWLLAVPHDDKAEMERLVSEAPSVAMSSATPLLQDFVVVRASLLTDGPPKGVDVIRAGWEYAANSSSRAHVQATSPGPAVGYTISRSDVGLWIMENLVKGTGEWNGRLVTITT